MRKIFKKRKMIAIAICLTAFFANSVLAQEFVDKGIRYERIDSTFNAKVLGFATPPATPVDLVIPDVVVISDGFNVFTYVVTSIFRNAFSGMPVQTLTLPASITFIGGNAFMHSNSAMLTTITYLGTMEPTFETSTGFPPSPTRKLILPNANEETFGLVAQNWGVSVGNVQFGSGTTQPKEFSATVKTTSFDAKGGSEIISVYSPVDWLATVIPNKAGLSLEQPSGQAGTYAQVMMTLDANSATTQRVFTIAFLDAIFGDTLKTLTITQAAPSVVTSPFEFEGFLYALDENTGEAKVIFYVDTTSISNVVIPATVICGGMSFTVTAILTQAFAGKPVQSVTIPASVTEIQHAAFFCPLTTITYLGTTEPLIQGTPFRFNSTTILSLPNASNGFTASLWGVLEENIQYGGTATTYYDVTFNPGAATITPEKPYTISVPANSLLKKPQDPKPGLSTYTFNGWFSQQVTGGTKWNFDTDTVTGTMTLYGQWTVQNEVPVTDILIGGEQFGAFFTVEAGSSMQLPVTILPENATNKALIWSAYEINPNDAGEVAINSDAWLTGVSAGLVGLRAEWVDNRNIMANCTIRVTQPPAQPQPKVKFNYANLSLKPQETAMLVVSVNGNAWKTMNWDSSNTAVATVSDGLVTAVADGKAEITASVQIDSTTYIARCVVYVEPVAIEIEEKSTVTDGTGSTEIALEIPNQTLFTGSFTVTLPAGVSIDLYATKLAAGYEGLIDLQIDYIPENTWKFTFTIISGAQKSSKLRVKSDATTSKIVEIVYNVDDTVTEDFELIIKDLSFTLEDEGNTVIEREETVVPVTTNKTPTNIINISEKSLTVYPNPVKDELYIVSASPTEKVEIYTLTGKIVKSEWISGNSINVSQLPQGIYLIRIGDYRGKFVKK